MTHRSWDAIKHNQRKQYNFFIVMQINRSISQGCDYDVDAMLKIKVILSHISVFS